MNQEDIATKEANEARLNGPENAAKIWGAAVNKFESDESKPQDAACILAILWEFALTFPRA